MENFKVVIWNVEETIAPAYYGCDREEWVDAFNCEASVYDPRTGETICSRSFENLTLEEFEALKKGEIEIIPTKVGTVILI